MKRLPWPNCAERTSRSYTSRVVALIVVEAWKVSFEKHHNSFHVSILTPMRVRNVALFCVTSASAVPRARSSSTDRQRPTSAPSWMMFERCCSSPRPTLLRLLCVVTLTRDMVIQLALTQRTWPICWRLQALYNMSETRPTNVATLLISLSRRKRHTLLPPLLSRRRTLHGRERYLRS